MHWPRVLRDPDAAAQDVPEARERASLHAELATLGCAQYRYRGTRKGQAPS